MPQYLTRQEIFDKAVGGVIAQGGASIEYEDGAYDYGAPDCRYRAGPTGTERACGIGQLIHDEHYSSDLEGMPVNCVEAPFRYVLVNIDIDHDRDFLACLQNCHDDATRDARSDTDFLHRFRSGAKGLAANYNLSTEILDA